MKQSVAIYVIMRAETGECYVGSSISLRDRWREHVSRLRKGEHHCRRLQAAWTKYGEAAFEFEVMAHASCETRKERNALEAGWIVTLGTYNTIMADERSGCFAISAEQRQLISLALKAKKAHDPMYRAFLEERGRAIVELMRSPESRANMAAHSARRWADPELRKGMAKGLVNRWADPNARDHMSRKTGERMRAGTAAADHSAKMKAAWKDPDKRANLQARLDARWAHPEAKARHSERMKRQWAARRAAKATKRPA